MDGARPTGRGWPTPLWIGAIRNCRAVAAVVAGDCGGGGGGLSPSMEWKSIWKYIQGVRAKFDTFCFHYISELLQDIDIG